MKAPNLRPELLAAASDWARDLLNATSLPADPGIRQYPWGTARAFEYEAA